MKIHDHVASSQNTDNQDVECSASKDRHKSTHPCRIRNALRAYVGLVSLSAHLSTRTSVVFKSLHPGNKEIPQILLCTYKTLISSFVSSPTIHT